MMKNWFIADNCTIDEDSIDHIVVRDGNSIYLRPMCWSLLIALLNAKKHNRILSYDNIGDVLWSDSGGWDVSRKDSLKEILKELREAIGPNSISNKRTIGYFLTYDIKQSSGISSDKKTYFEELWKNHCKGILKDHVGTGKVRELIDYYVIPSITSEDAGSSIPFSDVRFSKLLMAGSGFGKSTLLDIILLCSIVDSLYKTESPVLSENTKNNINNYKKIKRSLFGDSTTPKFPIFINSDKANSTSYSSILDLAEANETEDFLLMVDEAHHNSSLLFLIDSIDEVESDLLPYYLNAIKDLLKSYPNASVVFASRFLGKTTFPFEYDLLYIKELTFENIKKITYSILSQNEADKYFDRLKNNQYLYSLSKNPFMLMTVLESKGDRQVHHLLESIVNAIIDRRWEKHHYDISSEDIKLLLGYLACIFVFTSKENADISEIKQCFINAGDDLKLHGVSYDVPTQNVDYFLKTLSSQSGILNVINQHHIEKYLFQDDLIMCWLAANYIHKIMNESEGIHDREGLGGISANMYWLDNFFRSMSSEYISLSSFVVIVLVLTLVKSYGQDIQKSLLYYMICRDAISIDDQERDNIYRGIMDIANNTLGENNITNRSNSEPLLLINRILDSHTKKIK